MPRCFTCISTALFLTLVNPPLFGQSPLDVPGERKVTVRSEIARGQSEIFEAALNTRFQGGNLWTSMNDVIKRNKSLQKDSEGFLLGAHFEQVRQLDAALRSLRSLSNPNEGIKKQISEFVTWAKRYTNDVRALQKELGIDEKTLVEATELQGDPAELVERLLSSYEHEPQPVSGNSTPAVAPAASFQSPQFVTTTQPVSLGIDMLPAGTRFEFVSKEGSDVHIRYRGGEYAIPISATDLK